MVTKICSFIRVISINEVGFVKTYQSNHILHTLFEAFKAEINTLKLRFNMR